MIICPLVYYSNDNHFEINLIQYNAEFESPQLSGHDLYRCFFIEYGDTHIHVQDKHYWSMLFNNKRSEKFAKVADYFNRGL